MVCLLIPSKFKELEAPTLLGQLKIQSVFKIVATVSSRYTVKRYTARVQGRKVQLLYHIIYLGMLICVWEFMISQQKPIYTLAFQA